MTARIFRLHKNETLQLSKLKFKEIPVNVNMQNSLMEVYTRTTMKRQDAEQLVKQNGGMCKSSVTKDLSYLVTNDTTSGSSKNVKAAKLGIPVIDEKSFLELLG